MKGRPKKFIQKKNKVETALRFDNLDTPEKRHHAIAVLMNGRKSDFWLFLTEVLNANIKYVEDIILNDDDITDEERELFRWRRYYQIELRDTVDKELRILMDEDKEVTEPEKEDPYA